ncbi:hypothetical protein [Streptomyces lavenduligriseus]|uniref:Uncharacterized protein n=1 Tax=Streptomyces lavenduligriseus TaxID=67315 RepID=A0ABT0P396_9ACTN|nr:hypothetical protein [Streptomyces lavenduligriseus]MCL3998222.1 hypothetical protein [Streptomyces lavenduligriseus]
MGEQHEDQEHGAEPARPPLTVTRAREMTAGLREAMDDVRRCVAVLAARVRDAHAARVWLPLGHSSWESYCDADFGISRAQAYRLLDVACSLAAIHGAVIAGTETSRTRDSAPAAAAALGAQRGDGRVRRRIGGRRCRGGADVADGLADHCSHRGGVDASGSSALTTPTAHRRADEPSRQRVHPVEGTPPAHDARAVARQRLLLIREARRAIPVSGCFPVGERSTLGRRTPCRPHSSPAPL